MLFRSHFMNRVSFAAYIYMPSRIGSVAFEGIAFVTTETASLSSLVFTLKRMGASPLLLFITKVAAAVVVRKLRISHVLPLLSNKNSVYKRRKTLLINPAVINSFRVVRIILSKLILFLVEKADNKEKNPCLFCRFLIR